MAVPRVAIRARHLGGAAALALGGGEKGGSGEEGGGDEEGEAERRRGRHAEHGAAVLLVAWLLWHGQRRLSSGDSS